MTDPRKATDVLLLIEAKLDTIFKGMQSQDFTSKVIAGKLSSLLEKIDGILNTPMPMVTPTNNRGNPPNITMEAVNTNAGSAHNTSNYVVSENNMSVESAPIGFRRTSRPESFQNVPAPAPKVERQSEDDYEFRPVEIEKLQQKLISGNFNPESDLPVISVIQRVVDKNGKSIFLGEVEIKNMQDNTLFGMFKTSGTGKWSANMPLGHYRVTIRKRESLTKEKIEVVQDITVDGSKSPMELSTLIIK